MKFNVCADCGTRLIPESMHCPKCGAPADHPIPTDVRCECGFLLCKLSEDAIEVKCRRCKRLVYIPVDNLPDRFEQNRRQQKEARERESGEPPSRPADNRGQYCVVCGQYKPSVLYGKCLDCRSESIKVQYKSRTR